MTDRPDGGAPTEPDEHELLRRLRAADPASTLAPADADTTARLLEDTMSHPTDTVEHPHEHEPAGDRRTGGLHRSPLTWLVAAAAVTLIAVVSLTALVMRGNDAPTAGETLGAADESSSGTGAATVTELTAATPSDARCRVPSADLVATQELAFVGTVESIESDTVTLVPSRFYRGEQTDKVEVTAPQVAFDALIGAVEFAEGETYLVSATDGRVSLCGLSGPLTAEREQLYDAAFSG